MANNLPNLVKVPVWWSNGNGIAYRRDLLPPEHPQNTYNYIRNVLMLDIKNYEECSKEQLISLIVELETKNQSWLQKKFGQMKKLLRK